MFPSRRITMGGDIFSDEHSLAFDGTDDYINFGNALNLGTGDFSISVWIKTLDFHDTRILIKKQDTNNRYMLSCDTNSPPRLNFLGRIGGSSTIEYVGGSVINLDKHLRKWTHFVLSADRDGDLIGYINGELDASPGTTTVDDTDIDNTGNLQIGKYDSSYYDQTISEIAYYDKALSFNEVKTIYNEREPFNHKDSAFSGNLTAWWRMGDGNLDGMYDGNGIVSDMANDSSVFYSNKVSNSSFASDASSWTLGAGWAYDTGGVVCSSGNNSLSQDVSAVAGEVYKITLDVSSYTSGTLVVDIGGSDSNVLRYAGAGNSMVGYAAALNTNDLRLYGGAFRGKVDDITVYRVLGNPGVMANMSADDFTGDTP